MSMSSTGLYDQPLNDGANEAWAVGRRDALVLERYLSRSLQTLMSKGDGDPTGVLRDIQTLLAFCMNEYALQTAARCTTRGRLLRKLGDGYERLFVHLIDLLTQEREAAEDAQKSFQDDYDQEMEMVKAKVLEERSFASDESGRLRSQIVELQASLDRARADLEASNAKNGSLQMECDLYRQECDKAWAAKAQLEQRCSTAEARARDAEATAQDPDAAAAGSDDKVGNAEDWFNQTDADAELNRVREEKRLLESKLDAVTTAVLAGGGVEALQSALARVASGSRPSDKVSQSSSHWDESRIDGFRNNNATSVASGRRSRGASRGASRPSSEETAGVWRPARSASPDTPNRLVAPGRPDSRGADGPRAMGFSPGAGTLEDTYYQQLRQQGPSGSGVGSRGLSSSENRRPRSQQK